MNARRRSPKKRNWPENLYQKTDGYFWYRHPKSGKAKGLGHDRAFAFDEARKTNAAIAGMSKSSLVEWATGVSECDSLKAWLPTYKELWIERESPKKATLDAAIRYIDYIAEAEFAWMNVKDVTARHVSEFLDKAKVERSPAVSNILRSRLSDIFRTAATKGLVDKNPVAVTHKPSQDVKRDRLSLEQFLEIRGKSPTWLANAMNLALVTGQRREDLTLMTFSDVRDGFLYVIQGKSGGKTKLRIDTRIRLASFGMSIEDVIKQCRDTVVSKFIIHHNKTQRTHKAGDELTPQGLTQGFALARSKAKLAAAEGRTPPTFHEIRSLAERLYRDEYGADFAQALLGHKNAKTTALYNDLRGSAWQEVSVK